MVDWAAAGRADQLHDRQEGATSLGQINLQCPYTHRSAAEPTRIQLQVRLGSFNAPCVALPTTLDAHSQPPRSLACSFWFSGASRSLMSSLYNCRQRDRQLRDGTLQAHCAVQVRQRSAAQRSSCALGSSCCEYPGQHASTACLFTHLSFCASACHALWRMLPTLRTRPHPPRQPHPPPCRTHAAGTRGPSSR